MLIQFLRFLTPGKLGVEEWESIFKLVQKIVSYGNQI